MMIGQTFGKEEHLYLKKEIEVLFASKKRVMSYPFRALYSIIPSEGTAVRLLVSVPKRRLKHAVDRNRVKRLVRESYRRHKGELVKAGENGGFTILFGIIYIGETIPDYERVEKAVKQIVQKIVAESDSSKLCDE